MSDPLDQWEKWATVERGLSVNTVRAYRRDLMDLGPGIAKMDTNELREHLHRPGAKPATTARKIASWRSFYHWLVRTDQRTDDPTMKLDRPKVQRGLPRPVDDLRVRLERLDEQAQYIATLLAETGLRISEACSIDVEVIPDELRVRGKGNKERLVPLTDKAKVSLEALGGKVPLKQRAIQRRFKKAGFTPHQLRHTLATNLAKANVDLSVIQDLLGHSSPATTRVYMRNDTSRLREGLEARS